MEMPKPTKFHKKLEALVGDWTGDETMFPTPWDQAGGSAKGRYKVRAALDGFGVIQDYTQRRGGKTSYTGHGILGYDPENKCYLWHWSDSMGGVPNQVTTGHWKGSTLEFQHAGPMGQVRYVYTFHRDGTVGFAIDNSMDGEQWMPFMQGRYAKKGAKAPAAKKAAKKKPAAKKAAKKKAAKKKPTAKKAAKKAPNKKGKKKAKRRVGK